MNPDETDIPKVGPKEVIELEGGLSPIFVRPRLGEIIQQDIARLPSSPPKEGFL